jgi:hypothetical protein
MYPKYSKCTIFQMAIKCTNIFHLWALQNLPTNWDFRQEIHHLATLRAIALLCHAKKWANANISLRLDR